MSYFPRSPAAAAVMASSGAVATASSVAATEAPPSAFRFHVKSLYASRLAGVTCKGTVILGCWVDAPDFVAAAVM